MTIQIFMDILQLDYLYFVSALSFPNHPFAHIFALKKARYERFFIHSTYIRWHHPWHQQIRSLHLQDIRSLQGGAQHRTNHHQRQDEVDPVGR